MCTANSFAAGGSFDPTFANGNGFVTMAEQTQKEGIFKAAAALPDGGVVVAGTADQGIFFRRYAASATLDPAFGTGGTTLVRDFPGVVANYYLQNGSGIRVDHLLRYPDGHLIYSNNGKLLRLSESGIVDPGFRPQVNVTTSQGRPYFLFPRSDGGIVFAGGQAVGTAISSQKVSIRLFNADGSRDTVHADVNGEVLIDPLGVQTTTVVTAAAQQLDGKVLVAGYVEPGGQGVNRRVFLLRVTEGGVLDSSFGQGGVVLLETNAGFRSVSQMAADSAGSGGIAVSIDSGSTSSAAQLLVLTTSGDRITTFDVATDPSDQNRRSQAIAFKGDRIASLLTPNAGFSSRLALWTASVSGSVVPRTLVVDVADPSKTPLWAFEGAVVQPDGHFWIYGFRSRFDISVSSVIYQTTDSTLLRLGVDATGNAVEIVKAPGIVFAGALYSQFDRVLPLPDERSLVLERVDTPGSANRTLQLRRFKANGTIDPSYGNGSGKAVLPQTAPVSTTRETYLLLAADGGVYITIHYIGCFQNDCQNQIVIDKLRADGTLDTSFGPSGNGTYTETKTTGCYSLPNPSPVLTTEGKLQFVGYGSGCSVQLKRLLPGGAFFDPAFGSGGAVTILADSNANFVTQLLAQPDNGAVVVVRDLLRNGIVRLQRFGANGQLDPLFGTAGTAVIDDLPIAPTSSVIASALGLPDGSIVVQVDFTDTSGALARWLIKYRADGRHDLTFGAQGIVRLHAPGTGTRITATFGTLALQPDGKLLVAYASSLFPFVTTTITRINPDGSFDTTFTADGSSDSAINIDGSGNAIIDIAVTADGRIMLAGINGVGSATALLVRLNGLVEPQPLAVTVVEFYNTTLQHYFMTADALEAAAIDGGSAGPGWQRTGASFVAWSTAGGLPGNAAKVCRFYGTAGRGPNSHFYTASTSECAAVKQDAGWTYEGLAFAVLMPANDNCAGSTAVYRAYNNGFVRNDSNHRYSTQLSTLQAMQGQGWTVEGVAFCAISG